MMSGALSRANTASRGTSRETLSPSAARLVVLGGIGIALVVALLASGGAAQAAAEAGAELTRLLRAMAAIKGLLAVGMAAAVLWRLGAAVSLAWLAGYALACGAVAAGPVLVWGMAHVGAGALLTHAGLLGGILLLWRDPVVGARLATLVAARRARLRS
jgi:hypothetical protein